MNLFDVLFAKKLSGGGSPFPPVIKRVTGNPIEFSDGADAPLVKCVTQITGSQDLHGYDKPWVGGAGKNKLPLTVSEIKALNTSGTWSGNAYAAYGLTFTVMTDDDENVIGIKVNGTATNNVFLTLASMTLSAGSYILNGCPSNGSDTTYFLYVQNTGNTYKDYGNGVNITESSDISSTSTIAVRNGVTVSNLTFYPMIRLSTVADPTFEPYSNICPITAYTEGEIEIRGEGNIWDEEWENGSYTNGQKTTDASKIRCKNPISCSPSTTYYFAAPSNGNIQFLKEDGTYISNAGVLGNTTFTTPSTARYIVFNMYNAYGDTYSNNISINSPSTITEYKAYNGVKHTTTYPSAIYRGSEDVVNGEVTSEKVVLTLNTADMNNDDTFPGWTNSGIRDILGSGINRTIDTLLNVGEKVGINTNGSNDLLFLAYSVYGKTSAEWKALAMDVQIVIPLTTPTTSSVTPTNLPIRTLSGYNHIESSTGEMTIDYITDAYQNFVDTTERAVPSTRKGGVKAFDIFKTLDEPKKPEAPAEESEPEEKETEEGAKK